MAWPRIMLDSFHLRFVCILAIEIAAFPIVTMRYEKKMRRFLPFSKGIIALATIAIGLSFEGCMSWIAIKAALSITVHDWFSTSYTALERDFLAALILLVFILRGAQPAGKGWSAMLKAWWKALLHSASQASGIVLLAVIIFSIVIFLYNLHESCEIFVTHRPQLEIKWTRVTSGFELSQGIPQPDLTPEYLSDRQQYVVDISYSKDYIVPVSASILFQFPYPVDQWKINTSNAVLGGFSPNSTAFPLVVRGGNFQFRGQRAYRNWVMNVEIYPGGAIRLLVTLNINPPASWMIQGIGPIPPNVQAPPPPPVRGPFRSPLNEFIFSSIGFTFGGQMGAKDGYAPFQVDSSKNITLGTFGDKPKNLQIVYEMP